MMQNSINIKILISLDLKKEQIEKYIKNIYFHKIKNPTRQKTVKLM
jgi:hypothetical protein